MTSYHRVAVMENSRGFQPTDNVIDQNPVSRRDTGADCPACNRSTSPDDPVSLRDTYGISEPFSVG